MSRKLVIIKCPNCGREYLPAEIFIPKSFFGFPDIIKRDVDGKIIDCTGTSLDTTEVYCCDSCEKPFKVTATVDFTVEVDDKMDFQSDHITKIKPRFNLTQF